MMKKRVNVVTCPPCGESTLKGGKGVVNKETLLDNPPSALCATSPTQGGKKTACGFTLIELLVVVLIIGILAAIALPQYQKAVRKARLAKVEAALDTISKGIDMYLLENDFPIGRVITFTGKERDVKLDVDISCTNEDNSYCYTDVGRWVYTCSSKVLGTWCLITIDTEYNANKTTGNKWLEENSVAFVKHRNTKWNLVGSSAGTSAKPDICRWWKTTYGNNRVVDLFRGNISNACDAY